MIWKTDKSTATETFGGANLVGLLPLEVVRVQQLGARLALEDYIGDAVDDSGKGQISKRTRLQQARVNVADTNVSYVAKA